MMLFQRLVVLLMLVAPVAAQTSLIPASGGNGGSVYGPLSRSTVVVTGQGFSQAARLRTTSQPANTYDAGLVIPTSGAVATGDVIAGELWLRRLAPVAGDGFATVNFEKAGPDYDKSLAVTYVTSSTNWTRFRFAFTALAGYAAGGAQVAIHLGFPAQTIELGGLRLTNFARTQPLTAFPNDVTYPGREADAPWRAAARERIEQFRKADLALTVRDEEGFPVPGATVRVRMLRHAFGWGSAVAASRLTGGGSATDRQRYQGIITNWFNRVVLENDLKWPQWEPNPSLADTALTWLAQRGIPVRGHNLIWPGNQFLPADVPGLFSQPAALRERINRHFTNILTRTRGRCFEWDVINEPYANHAVMDVLGRAEMIHWFRLARALDPAAALYLNEYGNLELAGLSSPHTDDFFNQLTFLQQGGAPLDGLGMQGHFSGFLPHPERMLAMLDRFAALELPIAVTEFDVEVADETTQADFLRDFLTVSFSHPRVNSVLMWGFWAGQHWRPNAALFRQNWELRPHGVMWSNLVFRTWWTDTNVLSDAAGRVTVRGFKGDYLAQVAHGSGVRETAFTLANETQAGVVVPVVQPVVRAASTGDRLELTWPAGAAGYQVDSTDSLAPPVVWQHEPTTPAWTGEAWQWTAVPPDTHRYYRLRRGPEGSRTRPAANRPHVAARPATTSSPVSIHRFNGLVPTHSFNDAKGLLKADAVSVGGASTWRR